MQACIDVNQLKTSLKRIKAGLPSPSDGLPRTVHLLVQKEALTLDTVRASETIDAHPPTGSQLEEGNYIVDYSHFVNCLKAIHGREITLRVQNQEFFLQSSEPRPHQVLVASASERQWKSQNPPLEGKTYIREQWERHTCPTCGSYRGQRKLVDTYAITELHLQRIVLRSQAAATLLARIERLAQEVGEHPLSQKAYVGLHNGRLTVFAGSAHHLVRCSLAVEQENEWRYGVLFPIDELSKAIKSAPPASDVELQATISLHQQTLHDDEPVADAPITTQVEALQLAAGNYRVHLSPSNPENAMPKIQGGFPKTWTTKATCSRTEFIEALNTILPVFNSASADGGAWLHFGAKLRIEAKLHQSVHTGFDEIPLLDLVGPKVSVSINPQTLKDILASVGTATITCEIDNAYTPLVIRIPSPGDELVESSYALATYTFKDRA